MRLSRVRNAFRHGLAFALGTLGEFEEYFLHKLRGPKNEKCKQIGASIETRGPLSGRYLTCFLRLFLLRYDPDLTGAAGGGWEPVLQTCSFRGRPSSVV